jgi:hypothetical protein
MGMNANDGWGLRRKVSLGGKRGSGAAILISSKTKGNMLQVWFAMNER